MHHSINTMIQQIAGLDSWTQLSILGAWQYQVNSACINAAVRFVPDAPSEASGIDPLTEYEQARARLIRESDDSSLPSLIYLQRHIAFLYSEAGGTNGRGLEETLQFMSSRTPKREDYIAEYNNRIKLGMRPGMSVKQFVDAEYAQALLRHEQRMSRGDDAVRLCYTTSLEGRDDNNIPEWLVESMQQKLLDKLHDRWLKLELSRTNPRQRKANRDEAAASQLFITELMAEYGEQPDVPDEADDSFEAQLPASATAL